MCNILVRLPWPNQAVFLKRKNLQKPQPQRILDYLPVVKGFYSGIDSEIGPFMIIQDLGSRRGMGQAPREDPY